MGRMAKWEGKEMGGERRERRKNGYSEGLFAFILGSHGHGQGALQASLGRAGGWQASFSLKTHVRDVASSRGTGTHGWGKWHSLPGTQEER